MYWCTYYTFTLVANFHNIISGATRSILILKILSFHLFVQHLFSDFLTLILYKPLATFYRRQKVAFGRSIYYTLPIKTEIRMLFQIYWLLFLKYFIKRRKKLWSKWKKYDWIWNGKIFTDAEKLKKKSFLCLPITTFNNNLLVGSRFVRSFIRRPFLVAV